MSQTRSPASGRPYGLAHSCRVLEVARSTVYARRARRLHPVPLHTRGPKPSWTDAELIEQIGRVLLRSPFVGASSPGWHPHQPGAGAAADAPSRARPDAMWGTDATSALTAEGPATIFVAVDHFTAECVGIHAARRGTRFEALEPLRQGIRQHFGDYRQGTAVGLALRHDHGSQFLSHAYQAELRFLGIRSSPAFLREPEGNGCAERFIRTLKEQFLWVERFATVEDLRLALLAFQDRYNRDWLIQRHGHRSPGTVRTAYTAALAA